MYWGSVILLYTAQIRWYDLRHNSSPELYHLPPSLAVYDDSYTDRSVTKTNLPVEVESSRSSIADLEDRHRPVARVCLKVDASLNADAWLAGMRAARPATSDASELYDWTDVILVLDAACGLVKYMSRALAAHAGTDEQLQQIYNTTHKRRPLGQPRQTPQIIFLGKEQAYGFVPNIFSYSTINGYA